MQKLYATYKAHRFEQFTSNFVRDLYQHSITQHTGPGKAGILSVIHECRYAILTKRMYELQKIGSTRIFSLFPTEFKDKFTQFYHLKNSLSTFLDYTKIEKKGSNLETFGQLDLWISIHYKVRHDFVPCRNQECQLQKGTCRFLPR